MLSFAEFSALDRTIFNTTDFTVEKERGDKPVPLTFDELRYLSEHAVIYYKHKIQPVRQYEFMRSIEALSDLHNKALKQTTDSYKRCLSFLTLYARILERSTTVNSWLGYSPESWVEASLNQLRAKKNEATRLLRTTHLEELSLQLIAPLCAVKKISGPLFHEANLAAEGFAKSQLQRLFADKSLILAKVEAEWHDKQAVRHTQLIFSTNSDLDKIVVLPAPIAAYFASTYMSDLAKISVEVDAEKLKSIIETTTVLYLPSDYQSPYYNLQAAVDAAIELC